jgi:thiol-disulfide isomerase/thioredoxin
MKFMRIKNFLLLAIFILSLSTNLFSQGYKIKAIVKGIKSDTCYLGHYYGQYNYIDDTAVANINGEMLFEGKEKLPGGMYFIVLPKSKYFEIVITTEQNFTIETDTSNLVKNMKVKGNVEDKRFYEYLNYAVLREKALEPIRKRYTLNKDNKDSAAIIRKEMDKIDQEVKEFKLTYAKNNPNDLMAKVFLGSKDPEIPEVPILPNGRKDSTFSYIYYKNHFWDNIDFNDDRLLRTPIIANKIKTFFENVVVQIPDSIIKEGDKLVEKTKGNKEFFKYVVWYLTYTYETSKIMGFDAVFVHEVNAYYKTGQAWWVSKTTLDNIIKRSNKIEPNLMGKVAPNMIMQDTNLNLQSLHAIKAKYTLILFWDYNCGHCKTEMPKIKEMYDKLKKEIGFEIFGVCTDTSMAEMKKFIHINKMNWINVNGPRTLTGSYADQYDIYSTPVLFLLDEKKVIIAKRISYDQIEDCIRTEEKIKLINSKHKP